MFSQNLNWRLAAVILAATATVFGAQAKPEAHIKLEKLAFIAGHWRGELEGALTDWSRPEGDTIIGMYREVKAGKVTMYELLSIEQTDEGPLLLIKHFDPGLKGWEEKDHVVSLKLASWKENEARFERADERLSLIFRCPSAEILETTLEEMENGRKRTLVFREHRVE